MRAVRGPERIWPVQPETFAVVIPPGSPSTRKRSMCFPLIRSLLLREGEEAVTVVLVLLATSLNLSGEA